MANEISQLGTAGQFNVDGGGDCVEIPDSASLDGMNELTVQMWLRVGWVGSPSSAKSLLYKYRSYFIYYDPEPGYDYFTFGLWVADDMGRNVNAPSAVPFEVGRWYHIVFMYNGGTATQKATIRAYLDGELFYNWTATSDLIPGAPDSVNDSDGSLFIGGENWHHIGLIDDVRIYQDELTSAQVKKLYAEGAEKRGLLVRE